MGSGCPFCRIASGEEDAHVLHRDGRTVSFLDADPAAEGHTLVVPTEHVHGFLDMDGATAAALFTTTRVVALAVDRVLEPDGFSVFHTTGTLVGRVEHAHLHLVPRWADDSIHVGLERRWMDDEAAEQLAARIRAAK